MSLEQLLQAIRSTPELFGLLTFFMGAFIGHKLAIGRDKRNEFNQLTEAIYSRLIDAYMHDDWRNRPTVKGFRYITHLIPIYRRWIFKNRVAEYKEACGNDYKAQSYDVNTSSVNFDQNHVSKTKYAIKKILWHLR